ncbi:type II toxin-antitoxin system HipA family toxin [Aureimonas sp. Leaf324]|uniref:type II toxin-antitoxin system HipA family toxin n=1 Tax=Aureimonas sp. Leaf324 TaxID=1736336 RepID=UPI0006FF633D|nr:type II toxin-antitoxin system HipA family toxin [Aureimonas sp. Leaf324]KQQ85683.1 hypothetical protein ASF65_03805 [Aureimonas sp. Leaf324]
MSDFRGSELSVWYLGGENRRLVGQVRLDAGNRRCLLDLSDEWLRTGFELSPDLTLDHRTHAPRGDMVAPGAIEDAMPDRWGERMIRVVSRPPRMTPLDKLWYAGDRRFGALGVSMSADEYVPYETPALMTLESLAVAEALIARVMDREPLTERERQLVASAGTMGGAHPKLLIANDDDEWIAKFPRGSNVDQLLIEHACMELARHAGIDVADSFVLPGGVDHVLLVRRFDRRGGRRVHGVSARTMLIAEGDDSYAAMAGVIRRFAPADRMDGMRRELFRRMVFNVLIDNTDDHTKNHAFLRTDSGHWELSPAYDIPTQMNGLGIQAIQFSPTPSMLNRFDVDHAVAASRHFGLTPEEARQEWNHVAGWVNQWRPVFAACGVRDHDLNYLADFLDSGELLDHRRDAILAEFEPGIETGRTIGDKEPGLAPG